VVRVDVKLIANVLLDLPGGPEKVGTAESMRLGEGLGVVHGDLDLQVP
jgi:hypothetical protein